MNLIETNKMEKFKTLVERCKYGVYLTVNEHRNDFETVSSYFESNTVNDEILDDVDIDVYNQMVKLNTIVELQYYPDSAVGCYIIYHYDIEKAIDVALSYLNLSSDNEKRGT